MGIDRRPRTPHRKLRALAAYATKGQADGLTIYLTPGGQYAVIIDPTTPGLQGTSGLKILLADTSLALSSSGLALNLAANSGLVVSSGLKLAHAPVAPLFDHFADVANTDLLEDDLVSDTVAPGQLANNGDKLQGEYGGLFTRITTVRIRAYFGGQLMFDTQPQGLSATSAWMCRINLIRVSSTVVRYTMLFSAAPFAFALATAVGELTGLTLAATNIIKITGQSTGAAGDIVAKMANLLFIPAA